MPKSTYEDLVLSLAERLGSIRARDLAGEGIPTVILSRMVASGRLERSTRGIYTLPEAATSEHRPLIDLSLRVPSAVVCLLSALRHYQIGTQSPRDVWIAIPSSLSSPRVSYPRVRYVWMSPASLSAGVEEAVLDGISVRIFAPAKTVADCFKFRNKLGLDVAIEALTDSWRKGLVSMPDLWHFAKIDRVANVMRPYLETLST